MKKKTIGHKKTKIRKAAFVLAILALIVTVSFVINEEKPVQPAHLGIEDLSTEGFIEVTPESKIVRDVAIITLKGGCYRMTAGTDTVQAESIERGLKGELGPRPNTHDVTKDMFDTLGMELLMVKITDLKDRNFIGKIIVKQENTIVSLDSRPSDGIALAVRTDSKIYFNKSLMEENGQKIC